jgi:hypothetical protein
MVDAAGHRFSLLGVIAPPAAAWVDYVQAYRFSAAVELMAALSM